MGERFFLSKTKLPGTSESLRPAVAAVLARCRAAFIGIALVSGVVNILMLTGSLFMLQVYDRVLGSHSVPTLVALSAIAVVAYSIQGWLDILRSRVLTLLGERIDGEIGPKVHAAVIDLPLRTVRTTQETMQPFRDLEAVRSFMVGAGLIALFDLPWMPIYVAVVFFLHPLLGVLVLSGAAVLLCLTILTELMSRKPMKGAAEAQSARNLAAEGAVRGAEVVRAMGMLPTFAARWQELNESHLQSQRRASFVTGGFSVTAKSLRMVLQSAVLGTAAYLSIRGQLSAGAIIASAILSSRGLAPIDQAIAGWRGFQAARQGYGRLTKLLILYPDGGSRFQLPPPTKSLVLENLTVAAPGTSKTLVRRISFKLHAGQALGIIGPTASGKSTLARAIVGVWSPHIGKVMLDGASIDQWEPDTLGPSIGYMPQEVQLFDGTVAENIARFENNADPTKVIAAAEAAGFHDHVLAFVDGYEARIGPGGAHLSAGQRQRLGLARALYGNPFLVVLDEPNANLDAEGEASVTTSIQNIRSRGGVSIVIAHRPSAISAVDLLLVLRDGEVAALGPRDEVLAKTVRNADQFSTHHIPRRDASSPPPETLTNLRLKVVHSAGGRGGD